MYYVVAEALTNAAKHARASRHRHTWMPMIASLRLSVADDGIGGANPRGSGLIGLKDRVEALGGQYGYHQPRRRRHRADGRIPLFAA